MSITRSAARAANTGRRLRSRDKVSTKKATPKAAGKAATMREANHQAWLARADNGYSVEAKDNVNGMFLTLLASIITTTHPVLVVLDDIFGKSSEMATKWFPGLPRKNLHVPVWEKTKRKTEATLDALDGLGYGTNFNGRASKLFKEDDGVVFDGALLDFCGTTKTQWSEFEALLQSDKMAPRLALGMTFSLRGISCKPGRLKLIHQDHTQYLSELAAMYNKRVIPCPCTEIGEDAYYYNSNGHGEAISPKPGSLLYQMWIIEDIPVDEIDVDELEHVYDTERYPIRSIVDHRTEDGRQEFYVSWIGYPHSGNTWEPEENIQHVDVFAEYCAEHGL
jgi:hypothetical protein